MLFFSRAAPNLAAVIPTMDILDKELSSYSPNQLFTPAIRAAVSLAKQTLNRYYSLTDSSEVYRIAMILHPRHKLTYFKKAGWESQWIEFAEALLREEFERSYAPTEYHLDSDVSDIAPVDKPTSENIFDNLDAFAAPKAVDLCSEIDRYLAADIEHADNPLKWWHARQEVYPWLARMAMDYLSIPPTSIDVERLFSRGQLVLLHVRSRLSVNSTRALLCLGAWSSLGLVKNEDVKRISSMPDIDGKEAFKVGWDAITVD